MNWIIDRIEGDIAVIETSNGMINIPTVHLPEGTKEGSIINLVIGEDEEKTKRIKEKMDRLFVD